MKRQKNKKILLKEKFISIIEERKIFSIFLLVLFILTFTYILARNGLLIFLIFILFSALFVKKIKIKKFCMMLFLISFLVRFAAVIFIETPIMSDFAVMYNTARKILNGDMSYLVNSSYLNTWGYQMGHTMYLYILLKIFNSVTFLKIINCIVTSLVTVLIYLLAREFASEKASRFIGILYCFFPFPLLMNTVLTNQHVPALLNLLAFYLVIGKKFNKMNDVLKYILVGALLAIANVLRPEGIVFITSFSIYFLLLIRKHNFLNIIKKVALLLFTYFLIFNGCSYALKVTGYSNIGLENKNPLWKFVVGLNHDTAGVYSEKDASIYSGIGNDSEKKEVIKQRTIGSLTKMPNLFLKKAEILWTHSDLSWSLYYLDGKKIEKFGFSLDASIFVNILKKINQYYIYLTLILMLIGIIPLKNEKISCEKNLFIIVLLVFFGVYLLIEIMPRYAYSLQLFEYILAAIGLDRLNKYLKEKNILKLLHL